ncbi:hypothetical protein AB0G00_10010 [Nocardia salmonicida]|uniref:hypothetical protein n=1 Tax=Nocardia salmonicida TaxID=53431 RepID=UPI0033D9899D
MSKVTEQGAARRLETFFKGVTDDFVSKRKVFENEGRDLKSSTDNSWFHNYTSILKKYGLATPVKGSVDGTVVTKGLSLTDKGRKIVLEGQVKADQIPEYDPPVPSPALPSIPQREVRATTPDGVLADIFSEIEAYNAGPSPWEIVINDFQVRRKGRG